MNIAARKPAGSYRLSARLLALALAVVCPAGCQDAPADGGADGQAVAPGTIGLDELTAAHARLNEKVTAPAAPAGFATNAGADELAPISCRFHEAAGPGVFVRMGGVTPVGAALMRELQGLEKHGFEPGSFGMPTLAADLEAWRVSSGGKAADALGADVEGGEALLLWLRAAKVHPDSNLGKQASALAVPRQTLTALQDALSKVQDGSRADELEARLGAALLQWVVEFGFVVKAGPAAVTTPTTLVRLHRDAIVESMLKIVSAGDPAAALAALVPQGPDYARMLEVYGRYRDLAANGGCKEVPAKWRYPTTSSPGPEVQLLQDRLACEGFFEGKPDGVYDQETIDAVKKYQVHHQLEDTGAALETTVRSINVPMKRRAEQIRLALMRLREDRTDRGQTHIVVNIPAFELRVVEGDRVVRRQRVIVGTNKLDDDKVNLVQGHINRTRLMETKLYEIVSNPDWILPERVNKGELAGNLKKNPKYLEDNGISRVTLASGKEVMVQGSGKDNVLGKVKFLLEGSNAIFLHDTNDRFLFTKSPRAFSHGCVRVDKAVDFAQWLLERDGWNAPEVNRALTAKSVQRGMKLNTPVPLVIAYHTVEVSPSGIPVFYGDIYGYDAAFFDGQVPVEETVRWGHARLRPRWVPMVDETVVEEWKAANKSAPRDYKP